ncbi:LysR family transcriptional regulator [Tanticharoenia sakaeratensis]|jgi:DNA-binding transcriptional LysR family regulator|uniref:LysR family transcriptional regulator n=1 Tax=Tanticharoenia sakaeratensis NBRC 103193 TaxID=1231623 RepID=A0A0D6MN45_9PROT|nr:LysR family transcriptional regulator [Tanticharoenia sakaeratensis]GAN55104.1 LysR family transcriptional regulator [Tanticharoenia sakaeratensis NBRC 103193]GBQ20224.1 LysR family transcriptional regulator [Tanticharoenia sakaeratensis NBRC 103193]
MDWDKLRIFHAVAEAGSFTHAGDKLSLSQSAVSRQISALEEALSVSLFHRHARGLILTEQGETLNRTVRDVFSKLALTEAFLSESKEKAAGKLKVTTTTGFGNVWMTPRIGRFLLQHPDITVTLLLEDDDLDLGMREADVAVRMHPPHQADLIQRHLADFPIPIYASADYIAEHGEPKSLEELHAHKLLGFHGWHPPLPNVNWLFDVIRDTTGRTATPYFEVNNLPALATALSSGSGIGSLPLYVASAFPKLVKLMPDLPVPSIEAFFVYPEELRSSKRVSVFRDFLLAEIAATRHHHAMAASLV